MFSSPVYDYQNSDNSQQNTLQICLMQHSEIEFSRIELQFTRPGNSMPVSVRQCYIKHPLPIKDLRGCIIKRTPSSSCQQPTVHRPFISRLSKIPLIILLFTLPFSPDISLYRHPFTFIILSFNHVSQFLFPVQSIKIAISINSVLKPSDNVCFTSSLHHVTNYTAF